MTNNETGIVTDKRYHNCKIINTMFIKINYWRRIEDRAFALIEVVVLIAVFVIILAVCGREFLTKKIRTEPREITINKLGVLKTALLNFYADCNQFPDNLVDLETDPGVSNWAGLYIIDEFDNNDYIRDAWQQNFFYGTNVGDWGEDPCILYSFGPNNQDDAGGGDDIVVSPGITNPTQIDPVAVMHEKVRRVQQEIRVINAAAAAYGAYDLLVLFSDNQIGAEYVSDEWGNSYNTGTSPDEFYSSGPDGADDGRGDDDITETTP
ncbi:MAG: type II secretion system protein [Candidatus Omnitrophota bacterium]